MADPWNAAAAPPADPHAQITNLDTGETQSIPEPTAFAIDCEMIMVEGPHGLPERKVTVSVGIVDERLETIMYARVMKPRGSRVTDDSFVRTTGGLRPDWDRGVHISVAQELVRRFAETGAGVLVGWQLDSDLSALGFGDAAAEAADASAFAPNGRRAGLPLGQTSSGTHVSCDIVDLTDAYRTSGGYKCMLSEAYTHAFRRAAHAAHDAAGDARMTMELYLHWRQAGRPARLPVPLKFYCVTAHHFRPPHRRAQLLWKFLKPERGGRMTVLEKDDGRKYKLKFRAEAEREAYLTLVRKRVAAFREEQAAAASGEISIGGLDANATGWRAAGHGLGRGRGGFGGGGGGGGGFGGGGGGGMHPTEAEAWRRQRVDWADAAPLDTGAPGTFHECQAFKLHIFDADR